MHEVVHLSLGPPANELNTEFYNRQQTYFVYTKEEAEKCPVDPAVRFIYGREYTPRAVFWDYRNGFGKLKQFRFAEMETNLERDPQQLVSKLEISTVSTWTDRAQFPIHSSSMHTIPDWEVSDSARFGKQRGAPDGQETSFDLRADGEEQFTAARHLMNLSADDYLDEVLRPVLEKCDLLEGINLVTDMGGWGGFSTEVLKYARDDHLGSKPIFAWPISHSSGKIPFKTQISRLEMIVDFQELASLVFPLQSKKQSSFYEDAQAHLTEFESVCLLSSLRSKRVSMNNLVQDLTIELPQANIVQIGDNIWPEFNVQKVSQRNQVEINRLATASGLQMTREGDREHLKTTYSYLDPKNVESNTKIEINDRPLNLRKLVRHADHELRELVGDLTDNYVWRWESDSESDGY